MTRERRRGASWPPSRALAGAITVLWLCTSGCASAPPSASALPPPAPAEAAPPLVDENVGPDVVRCGVDDAPVPVGLLARGPDRRLALAPGHLLVLAMPEPGSQRALPPTVHMTPRLEGGLLGEAALAELFHPCGEQAATTDTGELAVAIAFGSSGAPRTTRLVAAAHSAGPSPFARCVAERACRLPVTSTLAGKIVEARVTTKLEPPVFRGRVEASLAWVPLKPSPREQRPSKPIAERMAKLQAIFEGAARVCAERLPPADDLFLQTSLELEKGALKPFAFQPSVGHGENVRLCIEGQLVHTLPTLSQRKQTSSALFNVSLQILAERNDSVPVVPVDQ